MQQKLNEWRNREALRVSACTLGHYAAELVRFAAWGGSPQSTAGEVDCYLAGRKLGGLGASGLSGAVCALKSFFRFVGSDAAAHLRAPRVKPQAQRTVDEDEAAKVLTCIDTSTVAGKRDLALIALVVDSGLRTSEVCRLRLADLDVERGLFTVIVKGGQAEFGVFHPYTGQLVSAWLAVRDRVAQLDVDTVFVSVARSRKMKGKALTRQAPKLLCRRLAVRAGVKPFTLHALRRWRRGVLRRWRWMRADGRAKKFSTATSARRGFAWCCNTRRSRG
jgi:integrase/recombinase XerC